MYFLLIALLILVVVTFVFFKLPRLLSNKKDDDKVVEEKEKEAAQDDCCGAHPVCEKDSLLSQGDVVYYDDEELDVFRHRKEDDYTDEEVMMFEEVLYTLRENEVAGWLRSLQARHIRLPESLRDEALLIVTERRKNT